MKKILVATDLSERSDRAIRRAIRLAGQSHGVCHVLHVVDDAIPAELAACVRDDAQARLERFVAANRGEVDARTEVLVGDPMTVIPNEVKRVGAQLVVLGLHRQRAYLDRLRETTMERLVRLLRTPVLLVRDPADHDYTKVLVPLSFSPACAAAFSAARRLAPNADTHAFHAVYLPFAGLTHERPGGAMDHELTAEARDAMTEWRAKESLEEIDVSFVTGALEDVLGQKLRSEKPDLVALGAHTRGRLAISVLGSFAADMIRQPPTDLLLAHP